MDKMYGRLVSCRSDCLYANCECIMLQESCVRILIESMDVEKMTFQLKSQATISHEMPNFQQIVTFSPSLVPEFIDPVFVKTSPKRSFLVRENERFGLFFAKTGSINSGTGFIPSILGGSR